GSARRDRRPRRPGRIMARFKKGTLDHDGDGRKGGSKKAAPKKSKPKSKPAPAKKPEKKLDAAEQQMIDLGRVARRSGIAREDCPVVGKQADLWRLGWDFQDK